MKHSRAEIIASLRGTPPHLDEVARQRTRRRFVVAATERAAAHGRRRHAWLRSFLASPWSAIATVFLLGVMAVALRELSILPLSNDRLATDAPTVPEAHPAAGAHLVAPTHSALRARLGATTVRQDPGLVVDFVRVDEELIHLVMGLGTLHVAFHPEVGSGQGMAIDTPSARIEVVGTEFTVVAEATGTTVRVTEGRVRMRAQGEGAWILIGAGESGNVGAPADADAPATPEGQGAAEDADQGGDEDEREGAGDGREVQQAARAGREDTARRAEGRPRRARQRSVTRQTRPLEGARGDPAPDPETTARFAEARALIAAGEHERARHLLYTALRSPLPAAAVAECWSLVAKSWELEREHARAADAYRRASDAGQSSASLRALIELARLLRGPLDEPEGSRVAYSRYLSRAPRGPHAAEARSALRHLRKHR